MNNKYIKSTDIKYIKNNVWNELFLNELENIPDKIYDKRCVNKF